MKPHLTLKPSVPVALISSVLMVSPATAALSLGDIALIGWHSTPNPDEVSFVALNAISAGEVFYIGDVSVSGSTVTDPEGIFTVSVSSNIAAGTVFSFTELTTNDITVTGISASVTALGISGDYSNSTVWSLGNTDAYLIFDSTDGAQSTANSTNLFFKTQSGNSLDVPAGLSQTSGLIDGSGEPGNFTYNGPLSGTSAELFAAISDDANWFVGQVGANNNGVGSSINNNVQNSGFTVNAVPEPSSLLLLGLSAFGLVGRRKR